MAGLSLLIGQVTGLSGCGDLQRRRSGPSPGRRRRRRAAGRESLRAAAGPPSARRLVRAGRSAGRCGRDRRWGGGSQASGPALPYRPTGKDGRGERLRADPCPASARLHRLNTQSTLGDLHQVSEQSENRTAMGLATVTSSSHRNHHDSADVAGRRSSPRRRRCSCSGSRAAAALVERARRSLAGGATSNWQIAAAAGRLAQPRQRLEDL